MKHLLILLLMMVALPECEAQTFRLPTKKVTATTRHKSTTQRVAVKKRKSTGIRRSTEKASSRNPVSTAGPADYATLNDAAANVLPPAPKEETATNRIFEVVEQQPSFPGGFSALNAFLKTHLNYPAVAQKNGVQGRVIVQFVVECDGSLTDVSVLRGVDPSLDMEAVRVTKAMPRWEPGMQNGQAVRVRYRLPVSFRLQ